MGTAIRIVMGIVWFFVFQFLIGMVGAAIITYYQRSQGVSADNIVIPQAFDFIALFASLALAVWGTISQKLPGTKKKK